MSTTPEEWITLYQGSPAQTTGWHFCSKECLFDWMMEHWHISGGFSGDSPIKNRSSEVDILRSTSLFYLDKAQKELDQLYRGAGSTMETIEHISRSLVDMRRSFESKAGEQ